MNVLLAPRQRIAIFWNRKCASRSIVRWCQDNLLQLDGVPSAKVLATFQYDYETGFVAVRRDGYFSVITVRHPALRLVSAYVNKFIFHPNTADIDPLDIPRMERMGREVVLHIAAKKGFALPTGKHDGITFNEFLDYLEDARARGKEVNSHWTPQFGPAFDRHPIKFDHVVAVETFDADIQALNARLGIVSNVPRVNATASPDKASADELDPGSLREVRGVNLRGKRLPPVGFLDRDTLARIARLFERDYKLLGYDPFDLSSLTQLRGNVEASAPLPLDKQSRLLLASGELDWPGMQAPVTMPVGAT